MNNKMEPPLDEAPEPSGAPGTEVQPRIAKSFLAAKRKLNESELLNPGSINLMIDEMERLQAEVFDLKDIKNQFHTTDKAHAILLEKLASYKFSEIAYNISISMGALMIGSAKVLWDKEYFGLIALVGGLALWLSGSAVKFGRMMAK